MNLFALPALASRAGARVDHALDASLGLVTAIFLALFAALLVTLAIHRRRQASRNSGDARKDAVRTVAVALALFGVVDGALFVNGLGAWRDAFESPEPANALRIEVEARQWSWEARYAGTDGAFGTADDALSLNRVVIPVGRPVRIELASPDVIHGFSVPALRTKRDAVPGHVTSLDITATEIGDYEIQCAQLCGVNHYKMRAVLSVVSTTEFDAWLQRSSEQGARAFDPADSAAHWAWPWSAR